MPGMSFAVSDKLLQLMHDVWVYSLLLLLLQGLGCRQQVWVAKLYAEGGSSGAGPEP